MCTLHANSAREAVTKLCTLPLLAGENVAHGFIVPTVAASVDLVIHVAKDASGARRVTEIAALPGRIEGDVVEVAQIFQTIRRELVRASGFPPHLERFEEHGFDIASILGQGMQSKAMV
jgi:pilus assembly protein CpaF